MDRLETILSKMSIHEKIGQLTQYNAMLFTNTTAMPTPSPVPSETPVPEATETPAPEQEG